MEKEANRSETIERNPVGRPKKADPHAEILNRLKEESEGAFTDRMSDTVDPFYVPANLIPDGWSVEWKATHIMGMPVPDSQMVKYKEDGWVPAPIEIFKSMKSETYDRQTIDEQGQTLFMRPMKMTKKKQQQEYAKAVGQVNANNARIGLAEQGQFERERAVTKINRSWEKGSIEIPE